MPTTTTFNALNQWKLLPLTKAIFLFEETDKEFSLEYLTKGSYASFVPIYSTRKSSKGGNHISAFKLVCKVITSQNNFADFQDFLYNIKNIDLTGLTLQLKEILQGDDNIIIDVQSDDSNIVKDITASFELNYSEEKQGLSLNIDVQAILSTDILTETNYSELLTQSWG